MEKKKENKKADYNPEVTKEDLEALGKKGLSMDARDDRKLQKRENQVDFTGKDLDVPKGKQNIMDNNSKVKDEENKFYSQGGERKNNLEERKDS
ncbi:MAG: hypothetical protein HKN61_05275 [Flavobacteriaceae bacterium]|nr:hypothetical protein [Flavobacteriaceae bacterium]